MSLATDLSPGSWPKAERESLEALEGQGWSPTAPRVVEGGRGIVSATVSPLSVYVGIQTLKLGGNAADAAAATALTQVTMQLGSVVSYAGIFTMLYYDAKERRVYSMDAGYNSYLQETDPKSIPVGNLGPLPMANAPKPTEGGAKGRETLVPGFMAGVDALMVLRQVRASDAQERNPLDGQTRWTLFQPASGRFPRNWESFHPSRY